MASFDATFIQRTRKKSGVSVKKQSILKSTITLTRQHFLVRMVPNHNRDALRNSQRKVNGQSYNAEALMHEINAADTIVLFSG